MICRSPPIGKLQKHPSRLKTPELLFLAWASGFHSPVCRQKLESSLWETEKWWTPFTRLSFLFSLSNFPMGRGAEGLGTRLAGNLVGLRFGGLQRFCKILYVMQVTPDVFFPPLSHDQNRIIVEFQFGVRHGDHLALHTVHLRCTSKAGVMFFVSRKREEQTMVVMSVLGSKL